MRKSFRSALGLVAITVCLSSPVAHGADRSKKWFTEETETLSNATVTERQAEFLAIGNMLVARNAIGGVIKARLGLPRALNREFTEGVEARHIATQLENLLTQMGGEDISAEDYNNALRSARTAATEQLRGSKPAGGAAGGAGGAGTAR